MKKEKMVFIVSGVCGLRRWGLEFFDSLEKAEAYKKDRENSGDPSFDSYEINSIRMNNTEGDKC